MALKRLKTKQSKRISCRKKYKVQKMVREHNRKIKREAKKNPRKGNMKSKVIQIPNICPFKETILKEVEEVKKQQEEERLRKRQIALNPLEEMVDDAEMRAAMHSSIQESVSNETQYKNPDSKEQSLKQYFKEFKKVVENADVILEVVDARDPLGTRCTEVERAVQSAPGNKRTVLLLNKADLVPKENLNKWIKHFRRFGPVTAFKASTQDQKLKLGQRKFRESKSEKALQSSTCVGAELVMSMLANYCRNKGIKTSIKVGIVGIPNVGKSSIINSLTRGKTCSVGSTPGVTKVMQEVELDSKIRLIDCPGIVFTNNRSDTTHAVLKNAQRVGQLKDPFSIAESVLKRASKDFFCKLYDITGFDTFEEFFAKKAVRMGKFQKKGVPDVLAAARSVLNDWNSGKIKYCTQPPEMQDNESVHVSAAIVNTKTHEFDVANFAKMEAEIFDRIDSVNINDVMEFVSGVPVNSKLVADNCQAIANSETAIIIDETVINLSKNRKRKLSRDERKSIADSTMTLEGNQKINRFIKNQLKIGKKQTARDVKKVSKIADVLNSVTLSAPNCNESKYDFDKDYII